MYLYYVDLKWKLFANFDDMDFYCKNIFLDDLKESTPSFCSFPRKSALLLNEFNRKNFEDSLRHRFDESTFYKVVAEKNWRIYDGSGKLLFHFFRDASPQLSEVTREFTKFLDSLDDTLFQNKEGQTRRFVKEKKAIHFGYHFYNPRHDESCGRKKSKTYVVKYKELKNDVRKLEKKSVVEIFKFLSSTIQSRNPYEYGMMRYYVTYDGKIENPYCFQAAALNKHPLFTTIHSDNDAGVSILFWGGDFQGGPLVLPQLGLILQVKPGDILCFNGNLLHYVDSSEVVGIRHSVSLFNKEFVNRDFII